MYWVAPDSLAILLKYPIRWKDLFVARHWEMLADIQGRDEELTELAGLAERKGKVLHWLSEGQ